jgi:hypothetical protein
MRFHLVAALKSKCGPLENPQPFNLYPANFSRVCDLKKVVFMKNFESFALSWCGDRESNASDDYFVWTP